MKRITANSQVEEVMMDIGVGEGQELRESEKRRSNLEKFAKLRSRQPETDLELQNVSTAFVSVDEDEDDGEFKSIVIPTEKYEQKVTDLPQDYFDYLIQKGMTIHEVGHILYSSWPAYKKYEEKVRDMESKEKAETRVKMFQNLWNVFEDGAIEKFLSEDYRVEEEILCLRSSIHEDHYQGKPREDGIRTIYIYPSFYLVMAASLCEAVYDNGELDKILDEDNDKFRIPGSTEGEWFRNDILPAIQDTTDKVLNEYDAEKRVEYVFDLWKEISDFLDQSIMSGDGEMKKENAGDNQQSSYSPKAPSNVSEGHGDQNQSPSPSSGNGNQEEDEQGEGDDSANHGKEMGEKAEEIQENSQQEKEIEKKGKQGVVEESKQEGASDWSDEIEEFIDILGAGDGHDELIIADKGEKDNSKISKAQNYGKRSAKQFRRSLHQLRKEKVKRGQRRGEFDPRRMVPAERGDTRVFRRTEKGDEYDYRCMIIDDRSGSISNDIDEVELATGSISYGLEANGVDVSVMDICNGRPRIVKPFGTKTDNFTDRLFTGEYGGGTPLRYVIKYGRKRMDRGNGQIPFMIIICDGAPNSFDSYREQIKKCNFPVLGLYIRNDMDRRELRRSNLEKDMEMFDKGVVSTKEDDIQQQTINLIRKIMF